MNNNCTLWNTLKNTAYIKPIEEKHHYKTIRRLIELTHFKIETIEEERGLFGAYLKGLIATNETADILGSRTAYLSEQDRTDEEERTQRIIERTAFKIMQTGETDLLGYILDEIENETDRTQSGYWETRNRVAITFFPPPGNSRVLEYKLGNSLEQILEIIRTTTKMIDGTIEVIEINQRENFTISLKNYRGKYIGSIEVKL